MQQINQIADHLYLIQQGNNSYIHRQLGESDTVVIKSVFHAQLFMEDDSACHSVHQRECQDLQNEWKILSQLNHPNIIKTQQFIPNHQLDPAGGNLQCCSLFLENASCDLHTLCKSNETSFKIIIKYFTQISIAVEYLHSQYIAHNDIKLENMLVIDRNVIKLADFGFSYRPSYEDLLSKWLPRTLTSYSSPEIVNFRINVVDGEYDEFCLFASDVYALTTALFLAVFQLWMIQYYQLLINQPDLFWQLDFIQKVDSQLMREHTPKQLLENLKDLIEGGLADEYNRITIQEFVNHEFFKYAKQIEGEQI
ncbi:unnamed protein product (macronuclear) [Paramecium tetraurelia]|uniref:Protein kinase domain-containing protein n=1 Tax=Paramecium tetraurelia TaxID=5888 RepID=A0D6E2_PARTE|nr:uncharacterized protein GSPATT00001650001 [Paramecium tetraurelia]CAK78609.1 unnamed protein product [Paramecium tetraurelia]|eukprot:XP_001446006.1 hypothetical protein (macronuclear) [Paramecium tetraurelia strain d4-2]